MKRVKELELNDCVIERIEVDFHLPVCVSPALMDELHRLLAAITNDLKNQPYDGVHWLAGSGQKPKLSKADAAFLGKESDPEAPETGEPTFDESVLYFESFSRGFVSVEEMKRAKERRALGLA